jgi:hypothetical protein
MSDNSNSDSSTPRSVSPASDSGKTVETPKGIWGKKIIETAEAEARVQPWKKNFSEPTGVKDLNGEDWIDYPAIYNVSKKDIAG